MAVSTTVLIANLQGPPAGAESAPNGWLAVLVLVALLILVLGAIGAVLRERHHRRRREHLEAQLADLERILVGLSLTPAADGPDRGSSEFSHPSGGLEPSEVRGPLSTAISTLHHDLVHGLPGPDRVDLRATLYLYEHLDQPMTPADLADGLNSSLRSVQRALSGSLGCTPRELILAIKMREAKRMLIEGDCRVQEAASAVGFDDPFHFSRRFKTYYRLSPTEMQNRATRSVA